MPQARDWSLRRLVGSSFATLVALILLVYSVGFYHVVGNGFWYSGLGHLEDHVHSVFLDLGPLYQNDTRGVLARIRKPIELPQDWDANIPSYVDRLSGQLRRVWVWDLKGNLVAQDHGPVEPQSFPEKSLQRIQKGLHAWEEGHPDQSILRSSYPDQSVGEPCQTLLIPLAQGDKLWGYLEISAPWHSQERALKYLSKCIVAFNVVAFFLAWFASAYMAGKMAKPLELLSRVCLKVAGGDLSARSHLGQGRNEIYQVSETFDTMVTRLEAAFQEQGRFVADASHELKTPVTALIGLTEMLKTLTKEGPSDRCNRTFDMMQRELDRMERLIGDLLELSKVEQKAPTQTDAVQLGELVRDAAGTLHLAHPDRKIRILEGDEQNWILGDSHALRRVFRNLLENAIRYSPADREVTVKCEADSQNLRVIIRDQGCGIPAHHLPFIFERFYRVDPSRARGSGGTGLGLSIVRAIVDLHGGQIDIASKEGEGTVVTVLFPRENSASGSTDADSV